ncbi:MAG: beta-ketoacyl synthase N-terminal-like domain-containing protein, partial [Opitutales bacterium]|nr:beta-ketoacyl synthase N-terminal-like domain-containing protein [Opitutales bacterium]
MTTSNQYERIFVTGMGVISSLGQDLDTFWANLLAGKSGICRVTHFDLEGFTCQVAAEIHDFDPGVHMDPKEAKRNDRYAQLGLAAAKKAVADSGLDLDKIDRDRVGVIVGSGIGGMETIEN